MAVEICRDNSSRGLGMSMNMSMSPRISFSHDLNQSDIVPIEPMNSSLLDYDFDFDFCVSKRSCDQESSLADELFENGIILPIEIKSKNVPRKSISASSSPLSASAVPSRAEAEEDSKETEEKQGSNSKSFWKFKRSKSTNCGSLYKRGLLWPLPLLSRSKSTGSTASEKGSLYSKDEAHHHNHNHHHQNHDNCNGGLKQYYQKNTSSPNHHQKPPLKKNYYGSNYGVVQVSPVLNVPTEKLLGLASRFSHSKDKGKKK